MQRFRMAASGLICALLLIVVLVPVSGATLCLRTLQDFAHAPIFGCVALLLLYVLRSSPRFEPLPWGRQYLLACIGATVLGGLVELAQIPVGRDSSWLDVRSDFMGAAAFLSLFALVDPRVRSGPIRAAGVLVGSVLLVLHSLPLTFSWLAYERRATLFPALADYRQTTDLYFVQPQRATVDSVSMPAEWATRPDEKTLQVSFTSADWPGLNFREPAPDWRGYRTLTIDITNPTDAVLYLGLRVHDAEHDNAFSDRFNRRLIVPPRTRTVQVVPIADIEAAPGTRKLDLRHVAGVMLFRVADTKATRMYVSRVALE